MGLRILGSFLVLVGGAGVCAGYAARLDPAFQSVAGFWWALFAAGMVVLAIGFGMCSAARGASSRASVGFIAHVATMIMVAGSFYYWRGQKPIAAVFGAALAAQALIGLILLPCVFEAKRRVGPLFYLSLLVYVGILGGSVFVAVKVM